MYIYIYFHVLLKIHWMEQSQTALCEDVGKKCGSRSPQVGRSVFRSPVEFLK